MQIKRFEAKNMTTALGMIKDELGPDAVILSAKSLRKGSGFFGSMKYAGVEVSAAIDNQRFPLKNHKFAGKKSVLTNRERVGIEYYSRAEKNRLTPTRDTQTQLSKDSSRYPSGNKEKSGKNQKSLSSLYQEILAQEVDRRIASEIIEDIKRLPVSVESLAEEDLRSYLGNVLEELGMVVDNNVFAVGKPRIAAFVGSSGVGKTTTIAKLAVLLSRRNQRNVALITLDNYGIAAREQLKSYAQIIGIPLETPVNIAELKQSIKKFKDKDIIIVDTPGINPQNQTSIQEIAGYFSKLPDLQIHLVLSAITKEKDLFATTAAFKELNINRLLFTKIDESITYGNMINLLIGTNIPLSFLCCGQSVPDDIEPGTTEKLVELLLNLKKGYSLKSTDQSFSNSAPLGDLDNFTANRRYFVANKNSDVYHCPHCKSSKKIKPDNMIKFFTSQEAKAKNFLPCINCKPDRLQNSESLKSKAEYKKISSYR